MSPVTKGELGYIAICAALIVGVSQCHPASAESIDLTIGAGACERSTWYFTYSNGRTTDWCDGVLGKAELSVTLAKQDQSNISLTATHLSIIDNPEDRGINAITLDLTFSLR